MKCPFAKGAVPSTSVTSAPASGYEGDEVTREVNKAILGELSRRGLLSAFAVGMGALVVSQVAACKAAGDDSEDGAGAATGAGKSFYEDVDNAKNATPITTTPQADLNAFKAQAGARGKAIGGVISAWLQKAYTVNDASGQPVRGLFDELFEAAKTGKDDRGNPQPPIFNPGIGPSLIFQQEHVTQVLLATDAFTVDPYAPIMQTATAGNFFPLPAGQAVPTGTPANPAGGFYKHYMLGTDDDKLYVADSLISRSVMKPEDAGMLRGLIRSICEGIMGNVRTGQSFDVVQTLCRYVPVRIVQNYIGLPSYAAGAGGTGWTDIDGLKAGDSFDPEADFLARFKLQKITKGVVPSEADAYGWIKDAFRNTFNNVQHDPAVADAGLKATELLLVWQARVIAVMKKRLQANGFRVDGTTVPDTMIARLLLVQKEAQDAVAAGGATADAARKKYGAATDAELVARTADDRVQSNSFGVFVGAIANPEEANARVIQSLLRFKEGGLSARSGGGSYTEIKGLALGATSGETNMAQIGKYALEFLRLNPQGETLLRQCVKDTVIGGQTIKAGTLVFNCHGAAMQDPTKVAEPAKVDIRRDPAAKSYNNDGRRTASGSDSEVAQSTIYLQHGYGRHKCLGRYASEITLQEVLRAVLRKGDPSRDGTSDLKMDANNLYADSFPIKLG